jgi:hypothetical protein
MFHILTILDDATRAVLASIIALAADLGAAVKVFRQAALRWGLPDRYYADGASIFDAISFRAALADLGVHRIRGRARNAPARGKIERFHSVLAAWFIQRLSSQRVLDWIHLQQLLDGVIASLYQPHRHRGIKMSPEEALAGRVSSRSVPPSRLVEVFRRPRRLKAHAKTGEVDIADVTYLVDDGLRGQRLTFLLDPAGEADPLVVDPASEKVRPLRRAAIKPGDRPEETQTERYGDGPLQAIYDHWRGTPRPLAEPGFGLPELFVLLGQAAGRQVPQSDHEAALVQRIYREVGPLPRTATEAALAHIAIQLGQGRPMATYLDALRRRVVSPSTPRKRSRS